MKRFLYIAFAVLLPLIAGAKVPVEDDIIDATMDASSPYYYTGLMLRYNAGDESLTAEDYHYLYYGYAYQESYKPLENNSDLDQLLQLSATLNADNPDPETLRAIIDAGRASLRRDPFSPKVLNMMAFAYGALGDKREQEAYFRRMNGVIRAITQSGDALTQKSPRHILMFDHALDVMTYEGLTHDKARVVSRSVEFIPLATSYTIDGKKRKGMYYDFSRIYWNKPEGYTYKRDRTWQFNNLKPRTYK